MRTARPPPAAIGGVCVVETRIAQLVALGAAEDDANTASTTALSTASSISAIVDDCAIYLLLDDHAEAPSVIGAVTVDVSATTVAPPTRSVLREVAARLREPPALAREG
jgi:hypothetical protein